MDMRKYLGSAFLKPADVKKPIRARIESIQIGQYEKPNLGFDDGSTLSCNKTNCSVLARAFGSESADWIGNEVELYLGQIDTREGLRDSVLVRIPKEPPADTSDDNSDAVPF